MRQDPETYTGMYNDSWLKDYVEALFQQQWGRNLSKYDGIQMLGGVTLNGRQILEDASKFKEDLEEQDSLHIRNSSNGSGRKNMAFENSLRTRLRF